jgi:DNA uptake protein ComE-like DNA-binding protein
LRALSASRPDADTALLPALAQAMARTAPDQGRRFVATLMETTYGALASPKLAAAAEALAVPGRVGDAEGFVPALQAARKQFADALADVQAHPARLAAQAGPALWLLHPTRKVGGQPLAIDLNTAEREHLLALPGIDAAAAERALASRASEGNFTSVADFAARAGLGPAPAAELEAMAGALRRAGPFRRE